MSQTSGGLQPFAQIQQFNQDTGNGPICCKIAGSSPGQVSASTAGQAYPRQPMLQMRLPLIMMRMEIIAMITATGMTRKLRRIIAMITATGMTRKNAIMMTAIMMTAIVTGAT